MNHAHTPNQTHLHHHAYAPRGAADKDDLVDLVLLQTGVAEDSGKRRERLLEERRVELLEARAGERLGEVDAVVDRFDFDADLTRATEMR